MNALTAVRVGLGTLYLLRPQWPAGLLLGLRLDHRARRVVQILGARHLLQAGVTALLSPKRGLELGSGIDLLHAGSMAALAAADPQRRRAALADAAVATTLGAAGWIIAQRRRSPLS